MRPLVLLPVLASCSLEAYTPPAQIAALDTPIAPAKGTDVQVEGTKAGALWGPELEAGNARVRHAISDGLVIEGESGVMRVTNDGCGATAVARGGTASSTSSSSAGANDGCVDGGRDAYMGRVGLMWHTRDPRGAQLSATVGAGGGISKVAGTWTAFDVGAGIAAPKRLPVRPFALLDASFNVPVDGPSFAIGDSSGTLLHFTPNATTTFTLGLELGSDRAALLGGFSMIFVEARDDGVVSTDASQPSLKTIQGGDTFFALGVGFRMTID